jgi:hypothetical protein
LQFITNKKKRTNTTYLTYLVSNAQQQLFFFKYSDNIIFQIYINSLYDKASNYNVL